MIINQKNQCKKNNFYSTEIERLSNLLKIKLSEVEQNKLIIKQFQEESQHLKYKILNQIDNSTQNEKTTMLTQEIDSWKAQFIHLNREYHKLQEQLILPNAELDSFKEKKNASFKAESFEIVKENQNSKISSYQYEILSN